MPAVSIQGRPIGRSQDPAKRIFQKQKKVLAFSGILCYNTLAVREQRRKYPGVAKFGIALEWGSRGRWFESSHSDQEKVISR